MKGFIIITALIELLAGAVLFVSPGTVPDFADEGGLILVVARIYGAAALALGYYAFMVWQNFKPGPVSGFLSTFIVFQIGVAISCYVGYKQGYDIFLGGAILHGVLGIITIYFRMTDRSKYWQKQEEAL